MRTLKTLLWIMAVLCLLAITGVFLPVEQIQKLAKLFGVKNLPENSAFIYLLRVGSATYFAIGIFYVLLALNPKKYGIMVPFSGLMALFIGIICGITGFWLALPMSWYISDAASTIVLGILILISWQKAIQTPSAVIEPKKEETLE